MARIGWRSVDADAVVRAAVVRLVVAIDAQRHEVAEVEASMGCSLERDAVMNLQCFAFGLAVSASVVMIEQRLLAHTVSPLCGVV
jgi:hypothetical protein